MPKISVKQIWCNEHGYRYPAWQVRWTDPAGKTQRKRFRDEKSARRFGNDKEVELLNVIRRTQHVTTTLSLELLDEAEAAIKRLGQRYSLSQVVDYFFQHHQEAEFKIDLSTAIVKFRGALEGQVRERTLIQFKSTLGQFEKLVGPITLDEINPDHVERFLRSLRAKDGVNSAAAKTRRNYRQELAQFFKWCNEGWSRSQEGKLKQNRWITLNAASQIKPERYETGHVEVLPLDRTRTLLNYVAEFKAGKYVPYFALAVFAGIRPGGEMLKLATAPECIHLANSVIRLSPAMVKTGRKTRRGRNITIQPNLAQWLSIFPGEILPTNADREIKAIRKKFGLSRDILRHTYCSNHAKAFGSFVDTAEESGNSERIIRDHYWQAVSKADAEAFWQILPTPQERKIIKIAS